MPLGVIFFLAHLTEEIMPKELGYKDVGDRVIVINPNNAFGLHGVIEKNDGFGEVWVLLDDGSIFNGYEKRDLIYESESSSLSSFKN